MSLHKRGNKWTVKWSTGSGENRRQHSQTFTRHSDAKRHQAEVVRAKEIGPARVRELTRSRMTLAEFIEGPWRAHATTLSIGTQKKYKWALDRHLIELLDVELAALDVACLREHQSLLLRRGVRPNTTRDVLTRLGSICQIAVESGLMQANPGRGLRKIPAERPAEVDPLSPVELERLIASLEGRDRILCVLAGHLGLRPMEARLATWGALKEDTLMVARSTIKRTARRTRIVKVPTTTTQELREWRLQCGRPPDTEPIIGPWTQNAEKCWSRSTLRRAISAATEGRVKDGRFYLLRHSHASALHHCGFTVPEAARRMGHGAALHLDTYCHVIDATSGQRWPDLDSMIRQARSDRVAWIGSDVHA